MNDPSLKGLRVLVVEDEYMLASDLCSDLEQEGAVIVGPIGQLDEALAFIGSNERQPDCAILDVNLGGDDVFPLADRLFERGVPMVFATGYEASTIPERFSTVPICQKPTDFNRLRAFLTAG